MKHIIDNFEFARDPHVTVVDPDFTALDKMYEGRKAYYGDYHCHASTGGTSDGKTTLPEWKAAMDEMAIDFIGVMDHRQVRHMYLDDFDMRYFVCGTEPGMKWADTTLDCHYLMIFPEKGMLENVLEKFPDVYEFEGGNEGHFKYIRVNRARFLEVKDAVLAEGGAFVNAHPVQQIKSDDINDFYFGDGTAFEIVYVYNWKEPKNPESVANYKMWLRMLDAGMKIVNTATSDQHGAPHNYGLNTVYATERHCREFSNRLRAGDLNSGYIGVKMNIGDAPVGSTVKYEDGMILTVKVGDGHSQRFDKNEFYRVDIITDKGIAYSAPYREGFAAAIEVQNRKFYRVEVLRQRDGSPAAIGNPIWLD